MYAEAKLSPKDDEKTKTIPINFHENEVTCKTQIFYILLAYFINYFSIVDSCQYLLLSDKILSKKKHLLPIHDTKLKQAYINNINWK